MAHRLVWSSGTAGRCCLPVATQCDRRLAKTVMGVVGGSDAKWSGRDDNYHSTIRNRILSPGQAQSIPVGLTIHCRSRSIIAPWGQN